MLDCMGKKCQFPFSISIDIILENELPRTAFLLRHPDTKTFSVSTSSCLGSLSKWNVETLLELTP